MFVTILSVALVALTPSYSPSAGAPMLGGGGPDQYGYRYLDSDTVCPGAPTYNWVSIKGVGTKIQSLGDDNYTGPFPIGFSFPYYWYRVDSVIVGSNGYITFGDRSANASPFNAVPSAARPNNQLAPLLSDLDCSAGGSPNGSVWYWSNGTDSFIVEYDSIKFWSTGGNNTFQIILCKSDSSITFQYKEQSGAPYNGWGPQNNQTGIENVSGTIGLNYLSGTTPPGNMYHPELAVRFFPPESSSLRVHDVGVRNAMNDRSGAVFTIRGRPLYLWAMVKNYGNQPEGEYKVYFRILRQNNTVIFQDSLMAAASNPGQVESLALANAWWPANNGVFIIKVITRLAGDIVPVNDTATLELRVVSVPGALLTYDSGTPGNSMYWNGPGGFGNRFVPPVYPCSISAVRQHMSSQSGSVNVQMAIYDDDGPGGSPGTVLYSTTINVGTADWYSANLPTPVVIDEGAFFVGSTSETSSDPSFGMDSIPPLSFQGWEYTGVWAPSRDGTARDICANATVTGPVGVIEWMQPAPMLTPARIDVSPNPFGSMTTVRLLNPNGREQRLELYDATGSVVRTLDLKGGQATLDGRYLSDGIYFARVAGTESPVAKVIVTH
ncbi:T9SS type A sorting domain-containing protein [candidate division WOR-3 bacterium]|nr:T9SS type A sorting domain-containing protein [candidate division WOR-3 bacterium]